MRKINILLNGQFDDYIVRSSHKNNTADSSRTEARGHRACEIINITLFGACVLVPRVTVIPDHKLKITIPSTAMNLTNDIIIDSEIRWSEKQNSSGHTRIGLMFVRMNGAEKQALKKFLFSLESPGDTRLPCHLLAA